MSEVETIPNGKASRTRSRAPSPEAAPPAQEAVAVIIPRIEPRLIEVEIVGKTPLLVCAWSTKAKQMILDKQMKKANKAKEAKNPEQCYLDALYTSTDGWTGIPAGGMKACLVNACRLVDGLPMTLAKRLVFVQADGMTASGQQLVRVDGEHRMHEGMVRIDSGTADIRFRPMYERWSIKLRVEFLANVISTEQVLNLIELAGHCEGLCEHRPGSPKSNSGDFGRFAIKREE